MTKREPSSKPTRDMHRGPSEVSRLLLVLLGGSALVLSACPREGDFTPPIAVSPGVDKRMGLLPRRTGQSEKPTTPAARSRAHVMKKGEELSGTNAIGRPGDILLENDEVVFVLDRLGGGVGFAESGGNVIDAADAKTRKDELGQMFTFFGTFPRQGVYDHLTFRDEPDGGALVEVKGKELYQAELAVTTTYHLAPGDRALLIRTSITNGGKAPVTLPGVGDAIQWGITEKFCPGKERGFKGKSESSFLGGLGPEASYAITSTEGHVSATSGSTWSDTFQETNVVIGPGITKTYDRVFLVGARGDTSSLLAELVKTSGGDVGGLSVKLRGPKGEIPAPLGARISVRTADDKELVNVVSQGTSAIVGEAPPGSYFVTYAGGAGRKARGAKVPVTIAKGRVSEIVVDVTEPGDLAFECASGASPTAPTLPCKATIVGVSGTETPDFGTRHRAGAAKNRITTETGVGEARLAPGTYEVTLSRGPEHTVAKLAATVKDGETTKLRGVIERVVDTTGYLACDFHQHSMLGADAPVGKRDRVIANAAEGLEVAMTTEHNLVADLSGIVGELGLLPYLVHVPGDEVTTDAEVAPFGHLNVFPLVVDDTKPRGGAFSVRGKLAKDVVAEARALPFPVVVQVNHPRSGVTGYFDQLKFDPKKGAGDGAGYTTDFDALEVWNGRNLAQRDKSIDDYLAMLASGRPVTPTGNTDTHGVVGDEPGYPRTLVRAKNDGALESWGPARTQELVSELRAGRNVVLTNGPFLRVTVNGKGPGDLASVPRVSPPASRSLTAVVHVEAPAWVDVSHLSLRLARGGKGPELALATAKDARGKPAYGCDARLCKGDVSMPFSVTGDDAVVVFARGDRELREVMDGAGDEIRPFAMTSAIFIDADGDGKALGR